MELSVNLGALPPSAETEVSGDPPIHLPERIRRRTRRGRRPEPIVIETEAGDTRWEF